MAQDQFSQRMRAYGAWKADVLQTLEEFQQWLDKRELNESENDLRIYETLEALRKDRLTLAFVAEFSRGKTELINAIFFASYGQRLLPSEAGRTTMCPSELFFDRETKQSYLRLLPIETRREERSISDYKNDPLHWVSMPLDTDSPEQMAESLREVVKTKRVPLKIARALGLYDESQDSQFKKTGELPEQVEIPMWRHALISFPHPLLQQGLVILDTPGLNALGNEPELTVNMLPSAQAVMFVLGADTGVTRSDLDMWEQHVHRNSSSTHNKNLVVALNKIDTLWDDLKDNSAINASIDTQRRKVAELLGVNGNRVFPVSAQKGLVGKVRNDDALLERSRLLALESFLADEVLPNKHDVLRDYIVKEVGGLLDDTHHTFDTRLQTTAKELENLRALRGKNADVIQHLMKKSREEQSTYLRNVEGFQSSRRVLQSAAKTMLDALSLDSFDKLINKTRKDMTGAWTTHGLKSSMQVFFDGARETMDQVAHQAEQTRTLIRATYRKFHEEHGLPAVTPKVFSVDQFNMELHRLLEEADAFRNSPVTAMTEQSFLIKKFFISLVSQARNVFFRANQDADNWLKEVMNPLVQQIKDHKRVMEKRLDTLRRISESRDTLEGKINELEGLRRETRQELETINRLRDALQRPLPEIDDSQTGTPVAAAG
ncbi:MAG: dynamin family protein [Gammaproteobacteria bacterium]|nr:dynamin family protein [Gammaproteobacteria bacterium]MBU2478334.1 dynamin family protein [Gammaproteobacteria bacterium]